jgi:glucose-1-phosphate adenylyltransferase
MPPNVLTVILAGGKGTRLDPLTRDRAKPAVPFGGIYRIIDFTLSNCINSGLRRVQVLTQFKSRSLDRHIRQGWNFLSPELNEGVEVLPPQQRIDDKWYLGTADALYQNIYSLEKENPEEVLILAGDHIYKMDYGDMLRAHRELQADLTVGCVPIPLSETRHFGIIEITADKRVTGFIEKPPTAAPMPGETQFALGSMGIYVFNNHVLFEMLCQDAADEKSEHDFGKNIIPRMVREGYKIFAHRFRDLNGKPEPYWRDVGTIDAYYQANMDLIAVDPVLNLYDRDWPVRTLMPQSPPPKLVYANDGAPGIARRGEALDSLICPGCIISGGHVQRSILSSRVRVNSYTIVEDSILFDGVNVGRYSRIRNAIIDKDVRLPPYTVIGYDPEFDRARGLTISDNGIVVVAKNEPPETFQAPNRLPT